jgi:hypothetical protein
MDQILSPEIHVAFL